MGKRKAPAPAPAPCSRAQGKAQKRTPTSAFDPAAGKDVYEPEKIIGQRMAKGGITQYNVKWVGYDNKDNTWGWAVRYSRSSGTIARRLPP